MLGRARFTLGDPAAARTLIEPLLSPGYPYREPAIAAHLQRTLIADRHHQDAIASLSTAIDLAHPEGIKRPFLHIGGRLPELLTTYHSAARCTRRSPPNWATCSPSTPTRPGR